jgi:4-hydroxybenzoate polyprenyltransferase
VNIRPVDRLRLLHYWWPVVMGGSIVVVVHRATAKPIQWPGLALLCCGILVAYSLDRLVDVSAKAVPAGLPAALGIAASGGMAAGAIFLARLPVRTALLAPLLGLVVVAYPRLKSLPALKTVLVPGVWTWSLMALPFADGSWLGWRVWLTPVAVPLMCLIASGCLLCDLKDVDTDEQASVSSLPVLLGVHATVAAAMLLALSGAIFALAEGRLGLVVAGLGLSLIAFRPHLVARDVVGPLLVDAILTLPGVLILLRVI